MNTTNLLCTQRFFLRGLAVFLEWSPQNLNPSGIFPLRWQQYHNLLDFKVYAKAAGKNNIRIRNPAILRLKTPLK